MKPMPKFLSNTQPIFAFLALAIAALVFSANTTIAQEVPPALNFTMKSIEGEDVSLAKYAGKVVVLVNTASKCCLLYTSPSPRDLSTSRMPSSA